jgi:hypothetical protein
VALSFGVAALAAAVNDAWNIGEGWLWFATASDDSVKANVGAPIDEENVVNKAYVDAQSYGQGGGVSCSTSCSAATTGTYEDCFSVCCMSNADGTDLICVTTTGAGGNGSHDFKKKYANGTQTTIAAP